MTVKRVRAKTGAAQRARPVARGGALTTLRHELRRWTDAALGAASTAVDLSVTAAKVAARTPGQQKAAAQAGKLLRTAREAAGMTMQQVGAAIDLDDPALLEAAETGKIALPFEVLLRLAAVVGRHDPLTLALQLTRTTQPGLWAALEGIGIGKLMLQGAREREFVNVYRGNEAARS